MKIQRFGDDLTPSERVFEFPLLNALESIQQLDAAWSGFVAAVAIHKFLVLGFERDGFDGYQCGGGPCGENLGEGGEFVVGDLIIIH